jgi:hypothetical protein
MERASNNYLLEYLIQRHEARVAYVKQLFKNSGSRKKLSIRPESFPVS